MAPLAKSSTEAQTNTDNVSTNNHQSLATKIRNIIIMENVNDMADDESHVSDVSDVVILLSRHFSNNKSGESTQVRELSDRETDFELNTDNIDNPDVDNRNHDANFQDDELGFSFAETEQILNAISLLSSRRVPPVPGRTKTSESGAGRTRRTRSIDLAHQLVATEVTEDNTIDGEDEDIQLLTSTFANILTLMSRRRVPPVSGRTKTSEPGAARKRKTHSIDHTNQSAPTEVTEDNTIDGEDEDIQLLTSTFANILTLMSRRRVPPVSGRTKTSESGGVKTRKSRSRDLFAETEKTEVEEKETTNDFDLWESSIANILTLMSRRRVPPVSGRTKTSESGAVRIYRIN